MAAKDGFEIAWSNPVRFAVVNGVGEIIMFLGKLMIAAGTTFFFYMLITFVSSIQANILKPIYLLIVVFIISYAVSMLFMSVYSIAMDTILQCFIVDEANQQAKGEKTALYAP
jgi:Plasma-membrane choline transporter